MLKSKLLLLVATSLLSISTLAADTVKMSQQQLLSLMNAPSSPEFVVLDVRTKKEFDQGHIAGAINISHDKIQENLAKLARYKDKTVVVHCRSGRRAGVAEEFLANSGFNKLRHLDGDMNGWNAANLPTVNK